MNRIKQACLQICLVLFFSFSVLSSALWMSGYLENSLVGASQFEQLVMSGSIHNQYRETEHSEGERDAAELSNMTSVPGLPDKERRDMFTPPMEEGVVGQQNEGDKTRTDGYAGFDDEQSTDDEWINEADETEQHDPHAESESEEVLQEESEAFEEISDDNQADTTVEIESEIIDIEYDLQAIEADLNLEQFEMVNVQATGYTAGYESTGKNPDHPEFGITYSGVKVRRDLYSTIAADTNVFPLGTILYIPSYGYGVVADTGGAIKGNKIDLYFETVEDVYRLWGKKNIDVYIIQPGDGEVSETLLDHLNDDETLDVYKSK